MKKITRPQRIGLAYYAALADGVGTDVLRAWKLRFPGKRVENGLLSAGLLNLRVVMPGPTDSKYATPRHETFITEAGRHVLAARDS